LNPQFLLDVPGIKANLKIGPQSFQVIGIDLGRGFALKQEVLASDRRTPSTLPEITKLLEVPRSPG